MNTDCKTTFVERGNDDPSIRYLFSTVKFRCNVDGCDKVFGHSEVQEHAENCCSQPAVTCLLECEPKIFIKGGQLMLEHLTNSCGKMRGTCNECKKEIIR